MTRDRQFKVVKRIAQPTGRPGAVSFEKEAIAGPFSSEEEAHRWIELNRQLGNVLLVEPIILSREQS